MKLLTGLAVAAIGAAAPLAAQKPATVVPIQLYSFGYGPSPIVLRAGSTTTLVFSNVAGIGHEFKAPAFFRSARILSGQVGPDGAIELKPHQSASVTLIAARGTYPVHCGHFFHTQMGMQSAIYVR